MPHTLPARSLHPSPLCSLFFHVQLHNSLIPSSWKGTIHTEVSSTELEPSPGGGVPSWGVPVPSPTRTGQSPSPALHQPAMTTLQQPGTDQQKNTGKNPSTAQGGLQNTPAHPFSQAGPHQSPRPRRNPVPDPSVGAEMPQII